MPLFLEANVRHYRRYAGALEGLPGIDLVQCATSQECNYHYVPLEIGPEAGVRRDELQAVLHAENALARRYFHPGCHRLEPYRSEPSNANLKLPNTERLSARALCMPTGTAIQEEEIDEICRIIQITVQNSEAVRRQLKSGAAKLHPPRTPKEL